MHVCFCCVRFSLPALSQEIGREERLRNDIFCVGWDVKPRLNSPRKITERKAVFLLTYLIPTKARCYVVALKPARETPTSLDDDGAGSVNSDVSDTASLSSVSSSSSSLRLSPDSTTLFDVSAFPTFKSTAH